MDEREVRACDVHILVDGDYTLRDCGWCPICEAWICDEDRLRLDFNEEGIRALKRRAKAALKRALGGGA